MKRAFIISIGILTGMALLLLSASPTLAQEKETLKIGVLTSLSGGAASWGIATLRGTELMADKINAAGGVKIGNKSHRIEIIKADDKGSPDTALTEANRLVFNEKLKFIIGPNISACTLAILPVTERNQVFNTNFSYSDKALGADKPHTFRLYSAGREYSSAIYNYLAKNRPDLKTVALIGPNDQSGWDNSKIAKEMASELGLKVVFEDYVQRGTTDYFPVLTKLIAKNPEVITPIAMVDGMAALTMQQARQLGYKGAFAFNTFHDLNAVSEKAGWEAMEGMININIENTNPNAPPGMKDVFESYTKKYQEKFSVVTNAVYPVLWILKLGMEKAGSLDPTIVAKALETLEGEHPYSGPFTMGGLKTYGAKHQIVAPIFMSEVKKGKQVYLGYVVPPVP